MVANGLRQHGLIRCCADKGQAHQLAARLRQICAQLALVLMLGFEHKTARGRMLRMQEDLGHRALFDNHPAIEHGDAIAQRAHDVHLMRDHDNRETQTAVDFGQQIEHLARGLWVERAGGLIAQQHLGAIGERARNADALLLPARKLRRIFIALVSQTHQCQQFINARFDLRISQFTGDAQRHGHVLRDRARTQKIEMLKDHADALTQGAQAFVAERRDFFAIDPNLATANFFEPVNHAHQGRFARARMADNAVNFASADFEADIAQGRNILPGYAIAFFNVFQTDHACFLSSCVRVAQRCHRNRLS